jgi:hypothetical protein
MTEETIYNLANCELMRLDVDTDHYYYGGEVGKEKTYYLSVTQVLNIGGPFPENLREWLRNTDAQESKAIFEARGQRGTQLHDALDRLMKREEVSLKDYPTQYEKDAVTTFIRMMRFLKPNKFETEQIVADPALRLAGTLDFKGIVADWKLEALMDPNKYLEVDSDDDLQLKQRYLDMPNSKRTAVIIDWKFTSVNAYNHKLQVAAYKTMWGKCYKGMKPSRAFTWRYSPKHKFGFDFSESTKTYKDFTRIYNTTIDYLGEFPPPPSVKRYPDKVRLYEPVKEQASAKN